MTYLGTNSLSSAKNYVEGGDTVTSTQISNLFSKYQLYFQYDDDYIGWQNLVYELINQTDTEAKVSVSGTAQIIEVDTEVWEESGGTEVEETTETQVNEFDFSGVVFDLKKVGEEWYLSRVPDKIF